MFLTLCTLTEKIFQTFTFCWCVFYSNFQSSVYTSCKTNSLWTCSHSTHFLITGTNWETQHRSQTTVLGCTYEAWKAESGEEISGEKSPSHGVWERCKFSQRIRGWVATAKCILDALKAHRTCLVALSCWKTYYSVSQKISPEVFWHFPPKRWEFFFINFYTTIIRSYLR